MTCPPPDTEPETSCGLDPEKVLQVLDKDGPLSRCMKGYEPREQQRRMLLNIVEAYNSNQIALIEAGTGTGKSMAYLIPAVLWALNNKERTVISTNTINLQEQLVHKDIPLLLKAMNVELKAVLVKGMGNYVCLRKVDEVRHELRLMPPNEAEEYEKIEAWSQTTRDGSRSSLPLVPSSATWEKVGAEHDTCNNRDCEHYRECFYFKARRLAQDAQILVVNHHLLCSDLLTRELDGDKEDSGLLPKYTRVVLDEAHNLEDIATDFFADKVSQLDIFKTLHRLSSDKQEKATGKLPLLRLCIQQNYKKDLPEEASSILKRLANDLPSLRWDLAHQTAAAFQSFANFTAVLQNNAGTGAQEDLPPGDAKLRLLGLHQTHPDWQNHIIIRTKRLVEALDKYVQSLISLEKDIKALKNEKLNEHAKNILFDINALATRLTGCGMVLRNYIEPEIPVDKVRWIEVQSQQRGQNTSIIDADLDVSKALAKHLFNKFLTIVLCSATMTTNQQFGFIRRRLGLIPELMDGTVTTENIYDSPFDFQKQALLAIPTDMPQPTHPDFIQAAAENIWQAIQASRGNAFVLFTSYSTLKACYDLLFKKLVDQRYHPLKQGDNNRQSLLQKFKSVDRSVLFGTDSFWEGVDVVGEALRCVIIVKLPFKVPSEPIIQARSEAIMAQGGDPFMDYALPHAIVKFKQGFGRLIRNRRDRGCIVCLDTRLLTKGYGRMFLQSLPNCQKVFAESEQVQAHMQDFYRKTYHLVQQK